MYLFLFLFSFLFVPVIVTVSNLPRYPISRRLSSVCPSLRYALVDYVYPHTTHSKGHPPTVIIFLRHWYTYYTSMHQPSWFTSLYMPFSVEYIEVREVL
jgi:hypothetical protein